MDESTTKFTGKILLKGINPYVLVSAARVRQIRAGWKKPIPVRVQVNGQPVPAQQINLMPVGDGNFYLYLDGNIRKSSGTQVGDKVEVSLAFDDNYKSGPQHDMLPEFAYRLVNTPVAAARWETLAPSLQKEVLRYLANLKTEQARGRNIERAIAVLSGAPQRFMARNWN